LPRLRRVIFLVLVLSLVCAAPAAAHPDPTTDGFRYVLVIKEHVVVALLPLSWPAKGSITGVYGNDGGRRHPGIDIGILRSLSVKAAAPGRVVHTGYVRGFEGYGKVVIERSGKLMLLYAHLSHVNAKAGQLITRGHRIGVAGCTGGCTGTHLHFEIRRGRRTVDPMRLLASAKR
jgi:murein DD-endopeptidase MepM/ murein hydrolase activator NlpD